MTQIKVDPFLLEIARTLDENNVRRRLELAHFPKTQRLLAAFHALKQAGFAEVGVFAQKTRWLPAVKAVRSMQLSDFKLSGESLERALIAPFYFLIEANSADCAAGNELVREYRDAMDKRQVVMWWRYVGAIVGGMAKGHIRMIGPEINGGFVFESLNHEETGATGEFLFTLGSRTSTQSVVEEIRIPDEIKGKESMYECLISWNALSAAACPESPVVAYSQVGASTRPKT